jgi:glycosyltransferase involved in cell wall biosynthesis
MDRYASRLVEHLPDESPDLDVELAGPIASLTTDAAHGIVHGSGARAGEIAPHDVHDVRRYVERYWSYPRRVRRRRADVVHVLDHSYAHVVRAKPDVPSVVSVHDLLPLITVRRHARGLRERVRNGFLRYVLDSLRQASAWIVSTEWMRGELATWLEDGERIHVIPYGVDDTFFTAPDEAPAVTRTRLGIPNDRFVVLHVGSVVERKNIPGVLAAVDGLKRAGVPAWLLQVGGTFTAKQQADIAARGLEDVVTQVEGASERDLRAAYRAADVLLFPSHYEGFGLPLLEAMASGLAIVTSGAAALAEVAGDAATVVEGRDPEPFVEALQRLHEDEEWREALRTRGVARARRFTWTETANRTADVYRALA